MTRKQTTKALVLLYLLAAAPSTFTQASAQTISSPVLQSSDVQAIAQATISSNLSGPIAMAAGTTVGGKGVVLTNSLAQAIASSISYLNHYSNATMTVPAIGLGAIGTGTITISVTASLPAPAVGDLCVIAPTSPTNALSYMIGTGWVTTAGTIKVPLEAGTVATITAGTQSVNVLCGQ